MEHLDILISDNGPQFSSQKYKEFSKYYQFSHETSSPHYAQSNGKVEKAVQTVKKTKKLKKTTLDKQDYHLALLELRNTPTDDIIGSPAQRLMGRRTKTLLLKLLDPKTIPPREIHKQQNRQKYYYDQTFQTYEGSCTW